MQTVIRNSQAPDVPRILELIEEFAVDVDLGPYLQMDRERLAHVLFRTDAFVRCVVAGEPGQVLAYAMFYPAFSSFRCQEGLYLEDIFVTRQARGNGVGFALLSYVAREAAALGYSRLDLLADVNNSGARQFYFRHGGIENESDRHFKFDGDAFLSLAG